MSEEEKKKQENNNENKEEKKEIEVITGDGNSLDISPVYDNVNTLNPKKNNEKPHNIVIPQQKK